MQTTSVLRNLQKTGVKMTVQRKEILEALPSHPLSAQEVAQVLKKKRQRVDLVTVYRTLELFCELGIVEKTQFEDHIARYEFSRGKEHHHHLVCTKCGVVKDVVVNEKALVKQVARQSNFTLKRHVLEFFGLCKKCS